MTYTARKVTAILLVWLCLLAPIATPGTATAPTVTQAANNPDLLKSTLYFQGQTPATDELADTETTFELRNQTSGNPVRTITTDSNGHLIVNTTDLEGEYRLYNESGKSIHSFQVVPHTLEFHLTNRWWVENGDGTHVLGLDVDSNRLQYDLELESDSLNLTRRVDGAERVNGKVLVQDVRDEVDIDIGDLENGSYTISASAVETTANSRVTFQPQPTTDAEFEISRRTYQLTNNSSYWAPHYLRYTNTSLSEFYIYSYEDGGSTFWGEYRNESGVYTLDTDRYNGSYYIVNRSSRNTVLTFAVYQQQLTADFDTQTLEKETSTMNTTLSVTSNRSDYDLRLWSPTLNQTQLRHVFSDTTIDEGFVEAPTQPAQAQLDANFTGMSAGDHQIFLSAADTTATTRAVIHIEPAPAPPTTTTTSSSGSMGGTSPATGGSSPPAPPTTTTTTTSTVTTMDANATTGAGSATTELAVQDESDTRATSTTLTSEDTATVQEAPTTLASPSTQATAVPTSKDTTPDMGGATPTQPVDGFGVALTLLALLAGIGLLRRTNRS